MTERIYLAADLGAESGRVMAGAWDGRRIKLEELHRFPNGPVEVAGSLRWDVEKLWSEVQRGLGVAAKRFGAATASVGVDTWGVDYALLSRHGVHLMPTGRMLDYCRYLCFASYRHVPMKYISGLYNLHKLYLHWWGAKQLMGKIRFHLKG